MHMNRLQGKKAVITGGTRGIGFAIAKLFLQEGAQVFILGTNEVRGNEAVSRLKEKSDSPIAFYKVDVSHTEETEKFRDEFLKNFETCDILVNCAGITKDKLFIRMSEEDWDAVLDTNLKSVYNMTHAFLRNMMKNHSGCIINITSVVGLMGNPGQTNYAASKAGMIGFTKSLAVEVGARNISVNCIAPGFIETDMTDKLTSEQKEQILKNVPMGKLGSADDIAQSALFLALSKYITGQTIVVDGGMTA